MPMIIQHIDAIAREKNRTVLWLRFVPAGMENDSRSLHDYSESDWALIEDYENNPARQEVINFLEANDITYTFCGFVASESGWVTYLGQLYIDVPYELDNPQYQQLEQFLEDKDGNMIRSGVIFCYLPLEAAMKNKHHDEPGFWDEWAEKF